ncbi:MULTISPECIES: carboxylesterase family protein [unclassified Spirosoma]|uniref:carboxylesterase/lipase family protein n=1 Tax=unclassified Spirosoma TaxID=2621999 RepID=UPI0009671F9F|nr:MULTISPECIES: carboxylesterase family protein [unclassified Spirosoma]MBN8822927.1 carboxylesterase/lipase family protein [Spirosoma sp.]OJW80112.1 MAG: carboxylesterase [Spirosoma sp. 48-14]
MKTNTILFSLAALSLPLLTIAQAPKTAPTPIMAGKDIAVAPTASGKVRGYIHNGTFTFKGIPYAKAERFMGPSKPDSWTGVRSSMTYGPVCPMDPTTSTYDEIEFPFHHDWGYTNENCLSLNVWTPQLTEAKKRPVMVWFHGGGFTAGSSVELPSYDGENLSKKGDVVVVTINHRLNILGFLDLSAYGDKYKNSPNAGLMDLVASLQWVKENIAQFGGDPNNVTIFGQSGGGGKVTSLMNAPSAKGLFHKAIVQSGSYLTSFTESDLARKVSAALLEELHFQPNQVDSLQKISYERLNAAGKRAIRKINESLKGQNQGGFGLGWGPIHDGNFLPYQISDPAAMELAKNIPLLVGSTKTEFGPFNPGNRVTDMEAAKAAMQKRIGDKTDAYMAAVKKAYPETSSPADYINIDINFRAGVIRQANQKAVAGAAPVYMYLFTWNSPVNDGMYKSMHCMEIPFAFNNIARCEEMTGGGKDAYALADKMSNAWIAFARTGNPNNKSLPNWPQYNAQNGATMLFDNTCQVKNHPDKELLEIASGKSM